MWLRFDRLLDPVDLAEPPVSVTTIDCHYVELPEVAAAYLVQEGGEFAFVEVNTVHAQARLLAALEAAGGTPDDVRWIIVTHVHLDHAGGAWSLMQQCPNATLLAHPRAAPHLIDPSKLERSARQVYGDETFEKLYGALGPVPAERVRTMDDGEILRWGARTLTFLHTRGHANHHFCIHDSETNGVFTGDTLGLCYPALQQWGRWVFPSTSPTDFDGPAALASLERIVATGAEVAYLTHFGAVGDVPGVAAELRIQLQGWVEAVQQADAEVADDALEDWFRVRVQAWFDTQAQVRGCEDTPEMRLTALDVDLNAQGLAFAVKKARFKRAR